MAELSRTETASILMIGITVAVMAWYWSDLSGVQRWTSVLTACLLSVASAWAALSVLATWDPAWYRS